MAADSPRDPLIDAALAASDGRVGPDDATLDGDRLRVMANLRRLAELKNVLASANAPDPNPSDEGDTPVPSRWGHLRPVAEIGRGSFGIVYRAFDPVLQRDVALKLRPEHASAHHDAAGYIDEARRLARVRHPGVLAVHGADVNDGRVGMWSDLLEGETLAHALQSRGTLSSAAVRGIAAQLAAALAAIHEAGLVHGDVKAGNVMLCGDRAVLMDFGAGGEIGRRPRYGSPATMAPELLSGEAAVAASDIYSLGAVLYQLATGELPPPADDTRHTGGLPPAAWQRLKRALGAPVATLVGELLALEPSRRPDAETIGRRLRRIESMPARRRRRVALAVVLLSLAGGLVASLIALYRVREAQREAEAMTNFIVDSVHNIQPEHQHGPATLAALFHYMGAHAEHDLADFPQALARVWLVAGQGVSEYGQPQLGLQLARRGSDWLDRHAPGSLSDRASAHDLLAMLLKDAHQPAEAEAEARTAIALFTQLPTSENRDLEVIHVRTLLGNVLIHSGRWREAAAAHRRILSDRAGLLGADSPALAVDYYNLGTALLRLNRISEARDAFRHAAALIPAPKTGVPDVHALYVQQSLAICEMERGDLDRARRMLHEVRRGYLHHYAPDHRTVLGTGVLLAAVERRSGHPQAALDMLRALPDKAFDPTNARLQLIHVLIDNARYDEARSAALPLRSRFERDHDPRAPYLPALLAWLDYRRGGDPATARAAIATALQAMHASGYDHLSVATELTGWRAQLGML